MIIRQTEILSDAEHHRLFRWHDDPFGVAHFGLQWRPKDIRFLLDVDDRPVSHVGLLKHRVNVGPTSRLVAGIGGVVTVPTAQGAGHASRLLRHVLDYARSEWNVDAGLLFCLPRMMPYYRAHGWEAVTAPVVFEQMSGPMTSPLEVMVRPLGESSWPDGPINLMSEPW